MLTLKEKIKKALKRPRLIKIRLYDDFIVGKLGLFQKKYHWRNVSQDMSQKIYKSYEDYAAHQSAKLSTMDLRDYDRNYYSVLGGRLKPLAAKNIIGGGRVALCLAARIGTEVKAFADLHCFAVGIDLNPGRNNKYVLYGDFHNIQFPSSSVDVVFTNSLDHALYVDRLASEIKRVLKRAGHLILEVGRGIEEGGNFGYYEASSWKKIDNCLEHFYRVGFKTVERNDFEYPWRGQQIVLKREV